MRATLVFAIRDGKEVTSTIFYASVKKQCNRYNFLCLCNENNVIDTLFLPLEW
jgi:hypothetical protein